jgi:predicted CxxxxCH...CXXCH cytochrome family protein
VLALGHFGVTASITFSGHAVDRGAQPTWDGKSCHDVACHGANLADPPATPAWSDTSGSQLACNACHGAPPTDHTTAIDCNRSICHGAEVTSPPTLAITPAGLSLHINGVVDLQ